MVKYSKKGTYFTQRVKKESRTDKPRPFKRTMIMKKTLIFIAAAALMASCGKKAQQADNQQDYTEESVEYILRDSTIYGFCGDGSAMNTLHIPLTQHLHTMGLNNVKNL